MIAVPAILPAAVVCVLQGCFPRRCPAAREARTEAETNRNNLRRFIVFFRRRCYIVPKGHLRLPGNRRRTPDRKGKKTVETKAARARPLRALKYVLLGVLLCAAVGAVCFLAGRSAGQDSDGAQISAAVLETKLSEISELASVSYTYTDMAQFESSQDFYGMKVPFTTKSFLLTYDGEIKAGVDLKAAAVAVRGTDVTVDLPEAKILSHEIDPDSVQVFDEKTSLFNPFTVEDFTAFQAGQKAKMEQKAIERGLLTQAQTVAEKSVTQLLSPLLPEEYLLTVRS